MRNAKILYCEDDLVGNLCMGGSLRDLGFEIVSTYCAQDAFEALSTGEHFGALVTDIDLGDGADGFAVARRARAAYPDLPIIYVSGTAAGRHSFEGVSDSIFLSKPCSPQQIVAALNRAIRLEAT